MGSLSWQNRLPWKKQHTRQSPQTEVCMQTTRGWGCICYVQVQVWLRQPTERHLTECCILMLQAVAIWMYLYLCRSTALTFTCWLKKCTFNINRSCHSAAARMQERWEKLSWRSPCSIVMFNISALVSSLCSSTAAKESGHHMQSKSVCVGTGLLLLLNTHSWRHAPCRVQSELKLVSLTVQPDRTNDIARFSLQIK